MGGWEVTDLSGAKTFYIEKNGKHYRTAHTDQPIGIVADAEDTLAIYSSPGVGMDGKYEKGSLLRQGRVDELATPIEEDSSPT